MERKLFHALDRQRFRQNERLAGIIGEVESRYAHALSDDDLDMVSAAGIDEPIKDETMLIIPGMPEEREK